MPSLQSYGAALAAAGAGAGAPAPMLRLRSLIPRSAGSTDGSTDSLTLNSKLTVPYGPATGTSTSVYTHTHQEFDFDLASITYDLKYPGVVLDHTEHIHAVFDDTKCTLSFTEQQAFQVAQDQWVGMSQSNPIILVTTNTQTTSEHTFFKVEKLECHSDNLSCVGTGSADQISSLANGFDALIGLQKLDSQDKTAGNGTYGQVATKVNTPDGLAGCSFGTGFDTCLDNQIGSSATPHSKRSSILRRHWLAARDLVRRSICITCLLDMKPPTDDKVPLIASPDTGSGAQSAGLDRAWSEEIVQSSFGTAIELKAETQGKVYCVDCHSSGTIQYEGRLTVNFDKGITASFLQVTGKDIDIDVQLGIESEGAFQTKFQQQLVEYACVGIEVPGVYKISPAIHIAVESEVDVAGKAQVVGGAHYNTPQVDSSIDVLKPENCTGSVAQPQPQQTFKTDVSIQASAQITVEIAANFHFEVASLFTQDASFKFTQQLEFSSSISGSGGNQDCGTSGLEVELGTSFNVGGVCSNGGAYIIGEFEAKPEKKCAPPNAQQTFNKELPVPTQTLTPTFAATPSAPSLVAKPTGSPSQPGSRATPSGPISSLPASHAATSGPTPSAPFIKPSNSGAVTLPASRSSPSNSIPPVALPTPIGTPSFPAASPSLSASKSTSIPVQTLIPPVTRAPTTSVPGSSVSPSRSATSVLVGPPVQATPTGPRVTPSFSNGTPSINTPGWPKGSASPSFSITPTGGVKLPAATGSQSGSIVVPSVTPSKSGVVIPGVTPTPTSGIPVGDNSTVCLQNKENGVVIVVKEDFNYYVHTHAEAQQFGYEALAWKTSLEGVLQDASVQRFMGVYEDEIKAYGVTRIRGFTSSTWPKTATWVSAVHYAFEEVATNALAFLETTKSTETDVRTFYPIVCAVEGRGSILFAATNPDDGIAKLTSPDCQQTITGGHVESCSYVSWTITVFTPELFAAGSW
ncbi:hypothetical protein PYCC9005_005660 [Savitreella phatthalungensis]